MVDKYGTGDDPYTYKGTKTLVNKFGIRDNDILDNAEREFTLLAAAEIPFKEPPYDFIYFCALHRALFGELFGWAGEVRSIDISKGSSRFCSCNFIEREAGKIFSQLAENDYFKGLDKALFIQKVAEYYCEINVLHPFREGNGRTQRILFEHICVNAGYNLNLSGVTQEDWLNANIFGFNCDYSLMEKIIATCLTEIAL